MSEEGGPAEQPKKPWALAITLGVLAVGTSIWFALRPPIRKNSGLSFEPSAEQLLKVEMLRAQIRPGQLEFRAADVHEKGNAKLFTYMAATSDNELVVKAALDAMQGAYSSRSAKKEAPDPDLELVLLRYLESPSPEVAKRAFQAARIPLMTESPRPELLLGVSRLAGPESPAARRRLALTALDLVRAEQRSQGVTEAFERALVAKEPEVISAALLGLVGSLRRSKPASPDAYVPIREAALGLTFHAVPAVRGRALALLTEVPALLEPAALASRAAAMLSDENGYVRGQAAVALGQAGVPRDISKLLPLARDESPTLYELSGFTELDGTPGSLKFDIPGRPTVADAVLIAIGDLAHRATTEAEADLPPLSLTLAGPNSNHATRLESAARAGAWFDEVKAKLP